MDEAHILRILGLSETNSGAFNGDWLDADGETIEVRNPATGQALASVTLAGPKSYDEVVSGANAAFEKWRMTPAPVRGEYIRQIGNAFREKKDELGALVTMEMGKIHPEGNGEVQEMIDVCDFAVGLSRQLYGLTMASERPRHRMYEQWHPLGAIGIITAFNFPLAPWAWNACIGAVCGDAMVWKPSPHSTLTAIAATKICAEVMAGSGMEAVFSLAAGGSEIGSAMTADTRLPLISATGSCAMGRLVGPRVAERLGRSLLELGGNNAMIVMNDADLELASRAALFAAVGTAGQRCTTLRRLIVHSDVAADVTERLVKAYESVPIGDPMELGVLMGPLVSRGAVDKMMVAIETAVGEGGELLTGGNSVEIDGLSDQFVEPTIIKIGRDAAIVQEETFAPILWVTEVDSLDEAIEVQNGVSQGLSSAIFTDSLANAETFLSHVGSDCGLANVNIGTSGAEIGGAFGGEKDTGGGRESGSDAWKAYMRRQTNTINWGGDLPLAQGIEFG